MKITISDGQDGPREVRRGSLNKALKEIPDNDRLIEVVCREPKGPGHLIAVVSRSRNEHGDRQMFTQGGMLDGAEPPAGMHVPCVCERKWHLVRFDRVRVLMDETPTGTGKSRRVSVSLVL